MATQKQFAATVHGAYNRKVIPYHLNEDVGNQQKHFGHFIQVSHAGFHLFLYSETKFKIDF
jgi:hypothetical protein